MDAQVVSVNGKKKFFPRIAAVTSLGHGRFKVIKTCGSAYIVEGGKKAGGTRSDWFVDGPLLKSLRCTSLMDAIRCISGM